MPYGGTLIPPVVGRLGGLVAVIPFSAPIPAGIGNDSVIRIDCGVRVTALPARRRRAADSAADHQFASLQREHSRSVASHLRAARARRVGARTHGSPAPAALPAYAVQRRFKRSSARIDKHSKNSPGSGSGSPAVPQPGTATDRHGSIAFAHGGAPDVGAGAAPMPDPSACRSLVTPRTRRSPGDTMRNALAPREFRRPTPKCVTLPPTGVHERRG